MSDPTAGPCCSACGFGYSPVLHLHHIHPLAETETPTNDTVWLCPNCHAMVHEIRRMETHEKRPSHYRMRRSLYDYWLTNECPSEVAEKLRKLADDA